MSSPIHHLSESIHAVLAEHGIQNARVVVDVLPGKSPSDDNRGDGIHSLQSSEVTVVVNGWDGGVVEVSEPAARPSEPPKTPPPPRATSPSGNVMQKSSATTPAAGDGEKGGKLPDMSNTNNTSTHHQQERGVKDDREGDCGGEDGNTDGVDVGEKMMESTARPNDVCPKRIIPPIPPQRLSSQEESPVEELLPSAVATKRVHEANRPSGGNLNYNPTTSQPTASDSLKPNSSRSICLLSPDEHQDSRGRSSVPSASRMTSIVLVEERRAPAPPVKMTPLGATPVFSILSTNSAEQNERSPSDSGHRKASNVQVMKSPREEELKHQPIFPGQGAEGVLQHASILMSAAPKKGQMDAKGGNTGGNLDSKFPPLVDQSDSVLPSTNVPINGSTKVTRPAAPHVDTWKPNSKQRLQEMLQEQREMEQQSLASRARHEELIKEAEKYLEELRRKKMARAAEQEQAEAEGRGGGGESPYLPQISPRGSKGSNNQAAVRNISPHCLSPTPSSCNSASGIKVVRFTMPRGGKEKEEVMNQLSTSPQGSQHISSKDKYKLLFQEQDKVLRQSEESTDQYKKLVEQAVAYHEQQNEIDSLQREIEHEYEERKVC